MKKREENVIWKFLIRFQKTIIMIMGVAVTVIVATACICRYLLDYDLKAYEEYLLIAAFWLYMMGGAHGSYEKSQITADILNVYLKEGRVKDSINIIKLAATFVLGVIFMIWAWQFASWTYQLGAKTPVYQIPRFISEVSIFIGFAFMSFYNLVYLYDGLADFVKKYIKKAEVL